MTAPFLMSAPGAEPVLVEGRFRVSASRLFAAWTTPEEIMQWFGGGRVPLRTAAVDARPGGRWEFAFAEQDGVQDVLTGEYVDVALNARLVFTWVHERRTTGSGTERTPPSLVTVTFEDIDGGSRLHLVHEQIIKETGRIGVGEGWMKSLGSLSRHLGGTPDAAR